MKLNMFIFVALALVGLRGPAEDDSARLETFLLEACEPEDNFIASSGTSGRECWARDSLPVFLPVRREFGWTENTLVSKLVSVASNNLEDAAWVDMRKRKVCIRAVSMLCDINLPAVTNYFSTINDRDVHGIQAMTIPAMFKYTGLEPEVMSYLRTMCLHTNLYASAADLVTMDLLECLNSDRLGDPAAATNRVASYIYFSLHHIQDMQGWHDSELARLVPPYSNSLQRLELARFLSLTAANPDERVCASNLSVRLLNASSNGLNDVSWLERHD